MGLFSFMGSSARGQFVRRGTLTSLTQCQTHEAARRSKTWITLWKKMAVLLMICYEYIFLCTCTFKQIYCISNWVLVCMHLSTHTQPSVSEQSREEHRPWHQDSRCVRGIVLSHSSIRPPTVPAAVLSVPPSLAAMPQWTNKGTCASSNALLWLYPSPSPMYSRSQTSRHSHLMSVVCQVFFFFK